MPTGIEHAKFCIYSVKPTSINNNILCRGYPSSFNTYSATMSVRPIVTLRMGINILESTREGYNWEVDQM